MIHEVILSFRAQRRIYSRAVEILRSLRLADLLRHLDEVGVRAVV